MYIYTGQLAAKGGSNKTKTWERRSLLSLSLSPTGKQEKKPSSSEGQREGWGGLPAQVVLVLLPPPLSPEGGVG